MRRNLPASPGRGLLADLRSHGYFYYSLLLCCYSAMFATTVFFVPYYVELGISSRLTDETRFLRGDGFVLEQGFVESAADAQKSSGFNKAFARNSYVAYSSESVYLNDNKAFVDRPQGVGRYMATLKYNGQTYGIREFAEAGVIYCDDRADETFPLKITVTTDDHELNYVMLKRNDLFLFNLRYYFERGCFRFKDLRCKEAVLKSLSY